MWTFKGMGAGMIAAALLLTQGVAALAQDEGAADLSPSSFTAEFKGVPAERLEDESAGTFTLVDLPVKSDDPRASGKLTATWGAGGIDVKSDEWYRVASASVELVNDDGTWVGTAKEFYTLGADQRTKKQKKAGTGRGPMLAHTVVYELTGEGGYDGLSLFLAYSSTMGAAPVWGMIVPTESVPPIPGPPAIEPADTTTE